MPVHQLRDALGAEEAHQVVFERQEELRRARIALTTRAAAQLAIDAPRLVALGADDVQTADLHRRRSSLPSGSFTFDGFGLRDAGAEFDVGAAAGHVRRDRDRARLARARDDLRLALVVLRVEHVVRAARRG